MALLFMIPAMYAQQPAADYSSVVDANTRFALKVARGQAFHITKNAIISPIALSSGFALLRNGASSKCADEIGSTFEFGRIPEENANRAYAALLTELLDRRPLRHSSKGTPATSASLRPNGLYLASSFWNLGTANFSQGFRAVNDNYYHAEVAHLRNSQSAVAAINKWADDNSFGTMTQVATSVAKDDFLFTSLLYFRAHWRHEFLASRTHQADFTLLSGTKKSVQMMEQSGNYLYERTREFEAIALPYDNGRYLYIFLPDKASSLRDLQLTMTDENWKSWIEAMTSRDGTIELPKFQIKAQVNTQALLSELGGDCAFASFAAFTKAVPLDGAKLTHAEQSLSFGTDELGSEAIAYTVAGGVIGGVPGGAALGYQPPPPFHMVVNRPFFAAIIDAHTRAIVLISSVVEP